MTIVWFSAGPEVGVVGPWERSAGLEEETGEVLVPLVASELSEAATLTIAQQEAEPVFMHRDHGFVSARWVAKTFPAVAEDSQRVIDRITHAYAMAKRGGLA